MTNVTICSQVVPPRQGRHLGRQLDQLLQVCHRARLRFLLEEGQVRRLQRRRSEAESRRLVLISVCVPLGRLRVLPPLRRADSVHLFEELVAHLLGRELVSSPLLLPRLSEHSRREVTQMPLILPETDHR